MSTNTVLAYFLHRHKEELGHPYMTKWGKDNTLIKKAIDTYGIAVVCKLMDYYFEALKTDEFLKKTGASIGVFMTQIPKLLLKLNTGKTDEQKGKL